jgi:hypothetical protein
MRSRKSLYHSDYSGQFPKLIKKGKYFKEQGIWAEKQRMHRDQSEHSSRIRFGKILAQTISQRTTKKDLGS